MKDDKTKKTLKKYGCYGREVSLKNQVIEIGPRWLKIQGKDLKAEDDRRQQPLSQSTPRAL